MGQQRSYPRSRPHRGRRRNSRLRFVREALLLWALVAAGTWLLVPRAQSLWALATQTPEQREAVERSVYYRNCDAARAAGAAPIWRGQPGYRAEMDGDSDGIACEPYR